MAKINVLCTKILPVLSGIIIGMGIPIGIILLTSYILGLLIVLIGVDAAFSFSIVIIGILFIVAPHISIVFLVVKDYTANTTKFLDLFRDPYMTPIIFILSCLSALFGLILIIAALLSIL
jgi:hypothetical protein